MHICFITDEYPVPGKPHGGIGSFVYALAHGLSASGIRVTVAGYGQHGIGYQDGPVRVEPVGGSNWKLAKFIDFYGRLNNRLEQIHAEHPIDVIEGAELSFAWLAKMKGIKYVIRLHGGHNFFTKLLKIPTNRWRSYQEKRSFKKADHFVAVTRFVLEGTRKFLTIPDGKATRILSPVDCGKFYLADAKKMIRNKIVFAGTVTEKKGVRQLVMAMPAVIRQFPNATLDVYGRDWIMPGGTSFIASLSTHLTDDIRDAISFKGSVLHESLAAIYETAHLCAFPSHMETQGIVVLETMSMGKAVLFSSKGPGPETIDHLKDGLIADPFSPEDIAEKIIHLFNHPGLELELGQNARKKMLEKYNLPVVTKQNKEFYERLLKT
ncbi:MAG: glycosyltransferase family 4 protein [Chitinophagaceae bacterium]